MTHRILFSIKKISRKGQHIQYAKLIWMMVLPFLAFADFKEDNHRRTPTQAQTSMADILVHDIFDSVSFKDRQRAIYELAKFIDNTVSDYPHPLVKDQIRQAVQPILIGQLKEALQSQDTQRIIKALDVLAYRGLAFKKINYVNRLTTSIRSFILPNSNGKGSYFEGVPYNLHRVLGQFYFKDEGIPALLSELRSSSPVIRERLINIVENGRLAHTIRLSAIKALQQNALAHPTLHRRMLKFMTEHIEGQKNVYLERDMLIVLDLSNYLIGNPTVSERISKRAKQLMSRSSVEVAILNTYNKRRWCQRAFSSVSL